MLVEVRLHGSPEYYSPLDGEAGYARLLSKDVSLNSVDNGLCRGLGVELLRIVLIVDIVANTHKLTTIVGTCQENDSNAQNVCFGDAGRVGGVRFEDELVDTDRDGAD